MIILEHLTKNDKCIIAEFIYSYDLNILIKSDLEKLIIVLIKHKVEIEDAHHDAISFFNILQNSISIEDRKKIMNDYYSGKL